MQARIVVHSFRSLFNGKRYISHSLPLWNSDSAPLAQKSSLPKKWEEFAKRTGHPTEIDDIHDKLPSFSPPGCLLPISFHRDVAVTAWGARDVFHDANHTFKSNARLTRGLRLLEPYLIPILALFRGMLWDVPSDNRISKVDYADHNVYLWGQNGIVLTVKRYNNDFPDRLAELILELHAITERNEQRYLKNVRVYGVLSDFSNFSFYSYDPVGQKAALDEVFPLSSNRNKFIKDMIPVANKFFSILVSTYVEGLRSTVINHKDNGKPMRRVKMKKLRLDKSSSLQHWLNASALAKEAYDLLKTLPVIGGTDVKLLENSWKKGIKLLAQSAYAIPSGDWCTTENEPTSLSVVKKTTRPVIADWFKAKGYVIQ